MSDDRKRIKDLILARRARFVGVALGAAGLVASTEACDKPTVCLSVEQVPTASGPQPSAEPQVCLEVEMVDAGASDDGGKGDTDVKGSREEDAGTPDPQPTTQPPRPRICLSPRRDPKPDKPKVCLSMPMPKPGEKDI